MRRAEELPQPTVDRRVTRHESPFSPNWSIAFENSGDLLNRRESRYRTRRAAGTSDRPAPRTDTQALMEAPPMVEPEQSTEAAMQLHDNLAQAVDSLPDRLRWVFEAHHYRGTSFRHIGVEMGLSKSQADRIYRQALAHLRKALSE